MALTNCPDCGRNVSDAAPTCPNCGRPLATRSELPAVRVVTEEASVWTRNRGCADLLIWGGLAFIVLFFVVGGAICGR